MGALALINIIGAAIAAAGPALKVVIAEAETIGADVNAHKDAMTTLEDALAQLTAIFTTSPLPVSPPKP